jgi:hypothetical protein
MNSHMNELHLSCENDVHDSHLGFLTNVFSLGCLGKLGMLVGYYLDEIFVLVPPQCNFCFD